MSIARTRDAIPAAALTAMVGAVAVSTMTAQAASAGCSVSCTVTSGWPGGFGANVLIIKLGDPLTGWTLIWSVVVMKDTNQYLLIVEAFDNSGHRYFRSWTSTDLAGPWTPQADTPTNQTNSTC